LAVHSGNDIDCRFGGQAIGKPLEPLRQPWLLGDRTVDTPEFSAIGRNL
jgi:hypothetical protein